MNSASALIVSGVLLLTLFAQSVTTQTATTGKLMQQKLTHAQRLLEAITTSNYGLLERESKALAAIPRAPGWYVLNSPEYLAHSQRFLRTLNALETAATRHDLDQAVKDYQDMTMSCYQCHKYIKGGRIAGAE